MIGGDAGDVGVTHDEIGDRARLGSGERESCTALAIGRLPSIGPVAVQVEAEARRRHRLMESVVALEHAFAHETVERTRAPGRGGA